MIFNKESDFEEALIKILSEKGWEKEVLKNYSEQDLLQNWANILFENNRDIDRLNDYPLTDGEMQQILEQIKNLRTPLKLNGFINGKSVSVIRDNPDDKLHFGKEVSLKIYDRREIAAGQSRYQIVQQPKFPTKSKILNDRRGDLMLLINGMPVIHIELKKSGVPVSQAYHQIEKYSGEGIFSGLFSLVQIFVAMEPNETVYFANPGPDGKFNPDYYFHWADYNNEPINEWDKVASTLLSIPMAHQLIGFYTVADDSDGVLKVMRSYQYFAASAISDKVSKTKWESGNQLGGYVWHTTGSGKTMTSFKSAQLIASSKDADIVKRKNRYSVVYTYKDDDGNQHQKWETFDTNADAKKRKTQIEFEQQSGTFIIPNATTVADLLEEYCSVYGVNNWAMSTYRSKKGLMYNYIIPLIGDVKLDELTPRLMDKFYQSLLKVKTKVVQNKKPKNEYLTVHTVREIHKFLRSAFNQAVKWELMTRNPVLNATLPKEEHQKREIWTAETLMHALEVCDDDILALAINLSFACSLRMGEMLGLTWDCIDISEESLRENNASIYVDKELQRVNRDVMEVLDNKDIIRVFPRTLSNTNTSLVLKTPKTKTSVRKIFLPSTVAQMLLERKKQIDEMKELFGDEYLDYDLVFCHSSGRPMEGQVINRALKKLIQDNDLPDVVFHSFRHASITYKLKWNGGDMKSVQGDSGHARMDMVADVYSHIIDEDRRYNAQKFEEQFYNAKGLKNAEEGKTAPMPKFETSVELLDPMAEVQKESEVEEEKPAENSTDENAALLAKLLSNPETAALLKALAKTI